MKKLILLICVLAMLLTLTGVASASPAQPKKFRIKGYTTYVDPSGLYVDPSGVLRGQVGLKSAGTVCLLHPDALAAVLPDQHTQGTFTMDETLFYDQNRNSGTLTIKTKKGDTVLIGFAGAISATTVSGNFTVTLATGAYAGVTGGGTYEGIPDNCTYDPVTYQPITCTGFYVDFNFNEQ